MKTIEISAALAITVIVISLKNNVDGNIKFYERNGSKATIIVGSSATAYPGTLDNNIFNITKSDSEYSHKMDLILSKYK